MDKVKTTSANKTSENKNSAAAKKNDSSTKTISNKITPKKTATIFDTSKLDEMNNFQNQENNKNLNKRDFVLESSSNSVAEEALKERFKLLVSNKKKAIDFENQSNDKEETIKTGDLIMPDPNSEDSILNRNGTLYKLEYTKKHYEEVKLKIRTLNDVVRNSLKEKDVKKIVNEFKFRVIKVRKTEIILKGPKYGYEIYYNNVDNRWWVVLLQFTEPFHPKQLNYVTYWVGNAFVGYGFEKLDDLIAKVNNLIQFGRGTQVAWRDFVASVDIKNNRMYSDKTATSFTYLEYKRISEWFAKNKIWIMVKKVGGFDSEDMMNDLKEKRKRGEKVNPLAGIQAKLLEPPRKPYFITAYPVNNPKYKGKEYEKVENKLFQIGFTFNE